MNRKSIIRPLILLLGLSGCWGYVSAGETVIRPFVKGTFKEIREAHSGTPFILSFWSETCGYCLEELALFGELLTESSKVTLVIVATDPFLDEETVNRVLSDSKLDLNQAWVFADQFAEKLYFDIDRRWRGELPRTYFFDAKDNVLVHSGVVKKEELEAWLAAQEQS